MKKKIGIGAGIVAAMLLAVYLGFSLFFQTHFCFGTSIEGIPVDGYNVSEVEAKIREEIDQYSLTLIEREDRTETIIGNSIGAVPVFNGEVEQLLEAQNAYAWPITLVEKEKLALEKTITYDMDMLEEVLDALSCMQAGNQRKPVDAMVSPYISSAGYAIVPADYGTTIVREALIRVVSEAVVSLSDEVDLSETGCYREPAVGDDDVKLQALIDEMNRYVGTTVTYEFGDKQEVLDGDTINGWLIQENNKVSVDEEQVRAFVKELGRHYNTAYQPKEFETSYGSTVTISNGFYGWRIDSEAEVAQLMEDLKSGEDILREPIYSQTANSHGDTDYGDSYVEINLTAQHLFLYKDGQLVIETDFVSGSVAANHSTPTGAFGVTYKTTDAILRGEDYATPVNYWMPFNGDVGMHDATWRGSFGGNIYKRSGSHGCINLPLSAARTIYQTIDKGYAVLVYTLPGTESATAQQQEAGDVINLINSIGPVTLESEPVITTARSLYNDLSDSARRYVTNYDVLVVAEAALAELKAGQAWEETPQW